LILRSIQDHDGEAALNSVAEDVSHVEALAVLSGFRREFYACLTARADVLFQATDALLCMSEPVRSLAELSLAAVFQRGHGALYDGLAAGVMDIDRLRRSLAGLALPRAASGQLRLAIDVSPWPRPDAETSPDRCHCYRECRCDGLRKTIPGWPYSLVVALESGRSSWTAVLDAQRLHPGDDPTAVTAGQLRGILQRLQTVGAWSPGDPPVLVVMDSGYDVIRLTFLLADLPVQLCARVRSDRVFAAPAPPCRADGKPGRPPRHGAAMKLNDPTSHQAPAGHGNDRHPRFGQVTIDAWTRMHQVLDRRGGWTDHEGTLPIIEGTLLHVSVDRLPGDRRPKPLWLWTSAPAITTDTDLVRLLRVFLRRFDIEHTFRLFKQILGWTRPRIRTGAQADRWTWMIIAAHTQLRLARGLTADLRRPWEKPALPGQMTPTRVRRGFRLLHPKLAHPAGAPKHNRPGPGRPQGRTSTPAPRHPVGKKRSKTDTPPTSKINNRG
jgi:hypothetical protein